MHSIKTFYSSFTYFIVLLLNIEFSERVTKIYWKFFKIHSNILCLLLRKTVRFYTYTTTRIEHVRDQLKIFRRNFFLYGFHFTISRREISKFMETVFIYNTIDLENFTLFPQAFIRSHIRNYIRSFFSLSFYYEYITPILMIRKLSKLMETICIYHTIDL